METFFTPSMIFLLAGIGFVGIVALHLIILMVHKISKRKEIIQQLPIQQQQGAISECNVSNRGAGAAAGVGAQSLGAGIGNECSMHASHETLHSNVVSNHKFGTLRSMVTIHNAPEAKPKLNSKLEKLEYPRGDIVYVRTLGQGAFGRVFQVSAFR